MEFLAKRLIKWYGLNKRDLPWRNTNDPYKIWISEIILQQTRVNQGINYYERFTEAFPDIKKLAQANEDAVLKLWQGLGYYSRARNLRSAAKQIVLQHNSVFPARFNEIKDLKGIGDYTAAAISSFAFNQPFAVVDGNVYRVLSRLFGVKIPIDSGEGKKYFQNLANELLPVKNHAIYNQAIMEFGALYCKPDNPDCKNCIFQDKCVAFEKGIVNSLPVKSKVTKTKNRYFNYFVFTQGDFVYIKRRNSKDIWNGLYEFYLVETKKQLALDKMISSNQLLKQLLTKNAVIKNKSKIYTHILSHQKLFACFYVVEVKALPVILKLKKIKINDLDNYALPRLIEKYVNSENVFKK